MQHDKSSMVERKDPHLGRKVVLGDGHDIQGSRPKQLTLFASFHFSHLQPSYSLPPPQECPFANQLF
jgi:hypothetical protein